MLVCERYQGVKSTISLWESELLRPEYNVITTAIGRSIQTFCDVLLLML